MSIFRNLQFKSLPQAIGLPFLSSQEDAQLKFKSGVDGIKRLYGEDVSWNVGVCGVLALLVLGWCFAGVATLCRLSLPLN
jgi:hypothetical protein